MLEAASLKPQIAYKPMLHGVGWPGDVKKIALKTDKLRALGYKPRRNSNEAVKAAAKALVEELRL
ncbi:MAG: hypothetical protein QW247_07725 [Pyrobaculum sp.]